MNPKANLRLSIRDRLKATAERHAQDPVVKAQKVHSNLALNERLIRIFETLLTLAQPTRAARPTAQRWAAYQPHGYEPDLRPALLKISQFQAIEWVFPRVESAEMEFYLPRDEESFLKNQWNLLEPRSDASEKIDGAAIDGFLIPAVAFDHGGRRLGRGKGHFDKYLARLNHEAKTKIGIAFDDQILVEDLPVEPHDVAMDMVLSEHRCLVSQAWLDQQIQLPIEASGKKRPNLRQRLRAVIPCEEFPNSPPLHFSERTKS